jgi:hypothetical protein
MFDKDLSKTRNIKTYDYLLTNFETVQASPFQQAIDRPIASAQLPGLLLLPKHQS